TVPTDRQCPDWACRSTPTQRKGHPLFLEVMALFGRARDYGRLATSPRVRRQVNADAGKEEGQCQAAKHVPEIMPQKSRDLGFGIRDSHALPFCLAFARLVIVPSRANPESPIPNPTPHYGVRLSNAGCGGVFGSAAIRFVTSSIARCSCRSMPFASCAGSSSTGMS